LAKAAGARILHDEGLFAWKLGIFSGLPKEKFNRVIQTYLRHPDVTPPTKGQSENKFLARWKRAFMKYRGMVQMANKDIALVVHSLNIGAVAGKFKTVDLKAGESAGIWLVEPGLKLKRVE
jgi:broad specificity phosphatase PhoE